MDLKQKITALREKLRLQNSWVFEELYDRQIKFICEQNDEDFQTSLEKAIEFLNTIEKDKLILLYDFFKEHSSAFHYSIHFL